MSEHRNAIAQVLLDPRYTNTGLTTVELYEKVKDSGLFPTKEHLSKVLSKMHGSNLVKRSIATQTYGSRWSITVKGRDLYRGAFDHTKEKLEIVDVKLQALDVNQALNEAEAEIEAAANALPESAVIVASEYLDEATKAAPAPLRNANCQPAFGAEYDDEFGTVLFQLGCLHTKALEQAKTAKKPCPIKNVHQKIEDLSNLNHAIKALVKMNVVVLDELIAELTELL